MRTFLITKPDDWHIHFRDESMLAEIVSASSKHFSRALVMPNLVPPLTTVASVSAYRERIRQVLQPTEFFQPYMTLYINESIVPDEMILAKGHDYILGGKLYPAGVTTNAEHGVQSLRALYPLFDLMQSLDLVLQIHGEVAHGDIFDREAAFISESLEPLVRAFPKLRVVLEHISSRVAVDFVQQASDYVAATITPHHLAYNRNHLLAGGVKPHYYCLPVLKRQDDQLALQQAAMSGNKKFFAGTDSAPHRRNQKESGCGCAGIFSAPYAIAMYTTVFDSLNQCGRLEAFMSHFGADFYQLPRNTEQIELVERAQVIPAVLDFSFGQVVPAGAGTTLPWSVNVCE